MTFYDYKTDLINDKDIVDLHHTGMPFYDQFLGNSELSYLNNKKNLRGDVVMMSPQEYYQICATKIFPNSSVEKLKREREYDQKILQHLKDVIQVYKRKLCMPMLNYAHVGQEGLHRMYVIGELYGWNHKVPVLVVDWFDKERAKKEAKEQKQHRIDTSVERAIKNALYYNYDDVDELKLQLESELDKEFEYIDEIATPVNIDLKETDTSIIMIFNNTEYPIEREEINFKEIENEVDPSDIELDDLDNIDDFLIRYFGDDWETTYPHLKDTFDIKESIEQSDIHHIHQTILTHFGKTYPGDGCIFISPEGTFINIYPELDDHEDLCYWLKDEGFDESLIIEDAEWFVDEFNYVRCRNSMHLSFIHLPKNITIKQLACIEEWMESKISSANLDVITFDSNQKTYQLDDYFPEDIIKIIKRYYSSGKLYEDVTEGNYETYKIICNKVRNEIVRKYGKDFLYGKCIEASEEIVDLLSKQNIVAETVEGWVTYDDDSSCSDRLYDEHTWVETSDGYILDVTATQFNSFMDEPYPDILISKSLPYGFSYEEPEDDIF